MRGWGGPEMCRQVIWVRRVGVGLTHPSGQATPDNSRAGHTQGALGKGWKASPACLSQHLLQVASERAEGCRPALPALCVPSPSFGNLSELGVAAGEQNT